MFTVIYPIDTLDPNPTTKEFDTFDEVETWVAEEVYSRVEHIVSHSPYGFNENEVSALSDIEMSLVQIIKTDE